MKVIKDDCGNEYKVSDFEAFKKHIRLYHSKNGKGDGSIHEENGFWFKVTEEFYDYVMDLQYAQKYWNYIILFTNP